jgi:precorrin-6Y C5,15-methyltransferase (decarboxylating)
MITKSEVRAAAVAKLDLPSPGPGTLWDVGAGSGSVAVECAGLAPGLEVIAIDRDPAACEQIALNAARHGVAVQVVHGEAPAALAALPDPDRVFLGGGGLGVLDGVMCRLRPDGRIVASFAAVDRAAAAASRLGAMVQVAVNRGRQLPDGGWRLEADNPVYLVWGPQ